MVTLGHIEYLNCIPVHGAILLKKIEFKGNIVKGTPAELNKLLEMGKIDISPSSSVEILKGHLIVPNLSISSKIDVQSIMLFTKKELKDIKKGTILITSHSSTSSLLVKIIFKEFFNSNLTYKIFEPDTYSNKNLNEATGILHIGDIALKYFFENKKPDGFNYSYDIAKLWHEKTGGLPFTFALWQIPLSSINKKGLKRAISSLEKSYNYFLENKLFLADEFSKHYEFTKSQIINYWDNLDFSLTDAHIESLKFFFGLLKKHKIINDFPEIKFI